ncbi:Integrase catalytic domain-containing protein [Citrus sinensis]|nr:Integrase catalytic domain-containing protein [Citrus sinensis]
MRVILIQQGLDSALEEYEDSKVQKGKEEGSSSTGADKRIINNKAHSTIILHLSDEVLREVAKEKTASGLWTKLEELFLKKSLAKRLYMKRKLYTFSMKDGTALKDHLDEFNKLILDLENVNIDLEDEDRALILLSSLPDSYEHFVDTLLYGRQTLTLKDVKNALESKDLNRRTDGNDLNPAESLVARAKPDKKFSKDKKNNNQKDKGDKKKKKRKCYFCHKEGHYIKNCFEKKRLEKLQKETNGKAAVASEDEGISYDADVLIAAKKMFDGIERDLKHVRYVPELKRNLISLGVIDQARCNIKAENGNLQIEENGLVIMKGIRRNGLYVLTGSTTKPAITASVSSDRTKLWHMRLTHMSEKGMKGLSKQGLLGNDQITSLQFCEKCVFGKATRHRFNPGKKETKQTLDYVHSDLWGPSQVPSHGGARYFITFIDDYSRRVWVYVLKYKNEAFEKFKEWTALMENQTEKRLKRLRTDNGLEYCNKDFENFCKSKGIARHRTVRNTPQKNGLAERMNRTFIEKVRCMLLNANLSKHFWAEAVNTAIYLINRSPSSALDFKTPQEVWSGKPQNLSNLRVFGCPAYAHISQGKLEPRAVKGFFIGYPEGIKGYKIWCMNGKPSRTLISRDVVFDEETILQ